MMPINYNSIICKRKSIDSSIQLVCIATCYKTVVRNYVATNIKKGVDNLNLAA